MSAMAVKYFSSSFSGFVSSYLKKQIPLLAYRKGLGLKKTAAPQRKITERTTANVMERED